MENSIYRVLKILKIELPDDPAISLVGIYPKKKSDYFREISALPSSFQHYSTVVKIGKQPL